MYIRRAALSQQKSPAIPGSPLRRICNDIANISVNDINDIQEIQENKQNLYDSQEPSPKL